MKLAVSWMTVVLLTVFLVSTAPAFKLPDTGQTLCYNATGSVISCAGTGQDGEYAINPMSLGSNPISGTVTDDNTGLMWQRQDDGLTKTWLGANLYCSNLSLAGHTDWRLPSRKELITIVDYGIPDPGPVARSAFSNTKAGSYWSSTEDAWAPTLDAWMVFFTNGMVDSNGKNAAAYARCVRGAELPPQSFSDNGSTVTDQRTHLMWQKQDDNILKSWQAALNYCNGLSLAGYTDWRLPNIKELESIVDDSRSTLRIDPVFVGAKPDYYWSSTTLAGVPMIADDAWHVDFDGGFVFENVKNGANFLMYTRCVRGGQVKTGLFRDGKWYLDYHGNGDWDGCTIDRCYTFGLATDIPVSGDWDGDGLTQIGVFRAGTWILDQNGNGAWGPGVDKVLTFGLATDIPVAGDWAGLGRETVGVFRNGTWVLDFNGNGKWDGAAADRLFTFGLATDKPVTGDWNGDGKTKIGVFRAGTWVLDFNGNGKWDGPVVDKVCSFGISTDIPVSGDWNHDGKTEVGVFRSGTWVLDMNGNCRWDGGLIDRAKGFGLPTDKPVTGIW